ncbi:MAG: hypothetical protein VZQ62_00580 [Methanosphaera sp.]|nr:hypothetical protein [Methanosphaera sp.]
MNNELNTVEDIDAMLDSQFNITDEQSDDSKDNIEETDGDVNSQETEEDENPSSGEDESIKNDDENSSNEEEGNEKSDSKPSADDKKEFAFSKMRKENSDLKNQLNEKNAETEFLNRLAAQYGYTDVKKFQADYEKARVQQEAKDKGLDPVLYSQLQESNKRIAELEKKQSETELMNKANNFRNAVDKAVADYNLGEDGRNEIFNKLEEAGFSVDTLLTIPNPEILIKGVLSDKIAEFSKQKQIDKLEKLDNLSDDKHNGDVPDASVTLDDIIAKEMKQYKADNFYD